MNETATIMRCADPIAPAGGARASIEAAGRGALGHAAPGRPHRLRARGRLHHPGRIRAAAPFPRRDRRPARGAHRPLPARAAERRRLLAAVPRRRRQHLGDGQGLLGAQADRRRPGRAAHGARPRLAAGAGRRGKGQRLHPHRARTLRPGALARRARHAGRVHAAAALVPVPHVQDRLLVADGADAAACALRQAGQRREPDGARHRRAVPRAAGRTARLERQPDRQRDRRRLFATRQGAAPRRAASAQGQPRARHQGRRGFHHRASQRRGRARRHLPGHGERRDDVPRARLPGRPPAHGHRAGRRRKADDRARRRPLLPALPFARLGHGAGRARAARVRPARGRPPDPRARLAGRAPDARPCRRLGGAPAEPAPRRLGLPVRQPGLSGRRRHRRGRARHAPRGRRALLPRTSPAPASGSRACSPDPAAGAPSTRRTNTIT